MQQVISPAPKGIRQVSGDKQSRFIRRRKGRQLLRTLLLTLKDEKAGHEPGLVDQFDVMGLRRRCEEHVDGSIAHGVADLDDAREGGVSQSVRTIRAPLLQNSADDAGSRAAVKIGLLLGWEEQ